MVRKLKPKNSSLLPGQMRVCVRVRVCDAVKVVTGLDGKNAGFGFSHPLVYALIQPRTLCAVLGIFIIFSKHLLSLAPSGRLESHFKD